MNKSTAKVFIFGPNRRNQFDYENSLQRKKVYPDSKPRLCSQHLQVTARIIAVATVFSAAPCFADTVQNVGNYLPPANDITREKFNLSTVRPGFARIGPNLPTDEGRQPDPLRLAPLAAKGWTLAPGDTSSGGAENPAQSGPPQSEFDEPSPEEVAKSLKLKFTNPIIEEVDVAPGEGRIFSDLRNLRDQITALQRPTARATFRYSSQSDDLDIRQEEVTQDFYFKYGRSRIGLGVTAINYDPAGRRSINVYGGTISGHHKFTDFAQITGEARINRIKGPSVRYDKLTYDVYATFIPSDEFRVDFDVNRRIFDNEASLLRNISAVSFGGSLDFTPNNSMRATVRTAFSKFNDTNRRYTAEVEGVWRVMDSPSLEIGFRSTNFHFTKLLNNGYFNPRDYISGEGIFRLRAPLSERFSVDLTGAGGVEYAKPGGTKPLVKGAARASYKVSDRLSLDAELSYFSSRSSSSSGFARTSGMIGLKFRF